MQTKLLLLFISLISLSITAQENRSPIVFELFTSQGCSSCPSADKLLDEIKQNHQGNHVYVLSYHVDYWNRLGWKDPFSNKTFSDYQRQYALQFGSRSIYTPQLVVNGSEHFTGSNHYKTTEALQKYSTSKPGNIIKLNKVDAIDKVIQIDYHIEGQKFNTLTLVLVVAQRITEVAKGENRNRTLKNTNIVANRIVTKEGIGSIPITIPEWITKDDQLSVIAYTQDVFLKTTGATKINL